MDILNTYYILDDCLDKHALCASRMVLLMDRLQTLSSNMGIDLRS